MVQTFSEDMSSDRPIISSHVVHVARYNHLIGCSLCKPYEVESRLHICCCWSLLIWILLHVPAELDIAKTSVLCGRCLIKLPRQLQIAGYPLVPCRERANSRVVTVFSDHVTLLQTDIQMVSCSSMCRLLLQLDVESAP